MNKALMIIGVLTLLAGAMFLEGSPFFHSKEIIVPCFDQYHNEIVGVTCIDNVFYGDKTKDGWIKSAGAFLSIIGFLTMFFGGLLDD